MELFNMMVGTLRASDLPQRDELGGHSAVWARRA
jgi:hypothetical protein